MRFNVVEFIKDCQVSYSIFFSPRVYFKPASPFPMYSPSLLTVLVQEISEGFLRLLWALFILPH